MISNGPGRVSGGKLALGIVLALIVGALTPLLTVLEMSVLMPVVLPGGVFMVFLFCYAGPLPAWLFMIVQLAAAGVLLGEQFLLMLLVAGTLPALVCMRLITLKKPFFDQMKLCVAASLAGMLAAVTIAYISFGGNMIERMAEALKAQFALMPDAFFAPFVDMINSAMSTGIPGVGKMTVQSYRAQIGGILDLMSEVYQQSLPGALLSGAALTGVLSVLWGNWLQARRGLATEESYVSPARWFLPRSVTLGLTLMWIAAFILSETRYAQGQTVYFTVYSLASLAFFIQALGAVDRFFLRRGMPDAKRRTLIILTLILGLLFRFINTLLFAIGAGSTLFGSHGAFRRPLPGGNDDDTQQ
ncbi:MAG: hypothetical protein IJH86_04045 [Clostridia bacterium]|nr:hypothetical protein [Clostridia bacterium]